MSRKALAASTLLALTACGVTEVDVDALEDDIAAYVEAEVDAEATVTCPDRVDWEKGGTFSCEVAYEDGSTQTANVEMVDDDGNVRYEFSRPK